MFRIKIVRLSKALYEQNEAHWLMEYKLEEDQAGRAEHEDIRMTCPEATTEVTKHQNTRQRFIDRYGTRLEFSFCRRFCARLYETSDLRFVMRQYNVARVTRFDYVENGTTYNVFDNGRRKEVKDPNRRRRNREQNEDGAAGIQNQETGILAIRDQ